MKRRVLRVSLFLLMALMLCNVLSKTVERLMRPEVTRGSFRPRGTYVILPGKLVERDGVYFDTEMTPPQAYVFAIRERSTLLGREYYVERLDVTYLGEDASELVIAPPENCALALYPTRPLHDGELVTVVVRSTVIG
jgi:hypothetical protein